MRSIRPVVLFYYTQAFPAGLPRESSEMPPDNTPARVTQLEELLMHQQQMLNQLNDVIIGLRNQVEAIEARCAELTERLENVGDSLIDDRPEKPPHY